MRLVGALREVLSGDHLGFDVLPLESEDLPQALQDRYTGWLDTQIINDFAVYAKTCFQKFGDRVKHWITFNEPHTFVVQGYYTLGIGHAFSSFIWLCGPITGLVVQPCVGIWSDKCTLKMGRRRPFILAGSLMISVADTYWEIHMNIAELSKVPVQGQLLSLLLDFGCLILPTTQCRDQHVLFSLISQVLINVTQKMLSSVHGWLWGIS